MEPAHIGRAAVFDRLLQHITTPTARSALVLLGRTGIGKTSLLRTFVEYDDDVRVSVYVCLSAEVVADEVTFWRTLIAANTEQLAAYGYNADRLPPFPDELADSAQADAATPKHDEAASVGIAHLRAWLSLTYLPLVFRITRPQRYVVWLLDDAHHLLDALDTGTLAPDFHQVLQGLLVEFPLLSMVFALHTDHDARLANRAPLVMPGNSVRLTRLSSADTAVLLRLYIPGALESVCEAVYRATGGDPRLVRHYGEHLAQRPQDEIYVETVRQLLPTVYAASQPILQDVWHTLDANERVVLRAIAALRYAHPLREVTAGQIESWLVDTDTPLDLTTIQAALRSLEYRELVASGAEGMLPTTDLLQRWLLETTDPPQAAPDVQLGRGRWLLLAVLVLAVVLSLVLLSQAPAPAVVTDAAPTVTLAE